MRVSANTFPLRAQVNHCETAEGPFPQGTGCLTCLSASLAKRLARSGDFRHFVDVARARNDLGKPCRSRVACAAASAARRMWHHEDAGISYNVWRTALAHRMRAALVHLPGRRRDPNAQRDRTPAPKALNSWHPSRCSPDTCALTSLGSMSTTLSTEILITRRSRCLAERGWIFPWFHDAISEATAVRHPPHPTDR